MLVGITVLVSLGLLGWMILRFSDAPFQLFAEEQMRIRLEAANADGVSEGTPISYLGVNVGRVVKVTPTPDFKHVSMDALVKPPLPANVEGRIRTQLLGGTATISLVLVPETPSTRPAQFDAEAVVPSKSHLKPDAVLACRFVGIPEFTQLSGKLEQIADDLRRAQVIEKVGDLLASLNETSAAAKALLTEAQGMMADKELRADIKATAANLRQTSESAKHIAEQLQSLVKDADQMVKSADQVVKNADVRIEGIAASGTKLLDKTNVRVDDVTKSLLARLEQSAKVLDNVEKITAKIEKGNGTAGKLVNDPALYETLVDIAKELKTTTSDINRLIEQWEQEGMSLKLKGK